MSAVITINVFAQLFASSDERLHTINIAAVALSEGGGVKQSGGGEGVGDLEFLGLRLRIPPPSALPPTQES